jgi:ferredoxin-thioredoxin reductase catalytic subunit
MSGDQNKGPIYGVVLYEEMPIANEGWSQAFPGREELEKVRKKVGDRTVAALEVLTEHHRALTKAIERSGFDICPCKVCGSTTVCIPDGLAVCKPCLQKAVN